MCKVGLYFAAFAAGLVVALTIDVLALPSVAGVAVEVRPAQEGRAGSQTVDRRHKTDRLTPPNKPIRVAPSAPPYSRTAAVAAISRSVLCQGRSA
jgi:hypothetical protein